VLIGASFRALIVTPIVSVSLFAPPVPELLWSSETTVITSLPVKFKVGR
jgi:hypothetical protein